MSSTFHTQYLLGHRGARGERLENTGLGFAYAQTLAGLDGVEFDIQMTQDGQFLVVHDSTLERLAQHSGLVSQLSISVLQGIYQSDYTRINHPPASQMNEAGLTEHFLAQPILALRELLPYLSGYRHIEFEIKTHYATCPATLVSNLLAVVSYPAWQALPITFTSFDTQILLQLSLQQGNLATGVCRFPTGLLIELNTMLSTQIEFPYAEDRAGERLIYDTFNRACILGCRQVGVHYPLITPRLMAIAQRFGLAVTAWTVNDSKIAKYLYDMGVTSVITDYPRKFLTELG